MTQLLLVLVTHKVHSTANPQALYLMTQLMLVLMTHKVDSTANPKALYLMTQLMLVLVTHKVELTRRQILKPGPCISFLPLTDL